MANVEIAEASGLASRWHKLKERAPSIRTRDAAAELDVSEAELIATAADWAAVRLSGDFGALIARLPEASETLVLTLIGRATTMSCTRRSARSARCPFNQATAWY